MMENHNTENISFPSLGNTHQGKNTNDIAQFNFRGTFVEAAFTLGEVENTIAQEELQGLRQDRCIFMLGAFK
jgi:hypothetical protein